MAKIGVEIRIDVTKIDKSRIFEGQKGKYLTMTTFIDLDQQDEYGNNGFIAHKKERDEQQNPPILGNSKVFWSDGQQAQPQQSGLDNAFNGQRQSQMQQPVQNQPPQPAPGNQGFDDFDKDIPF